MKESATTNQERIDRSLIEVITQRRCVDQAYQREWPVLLDPAVEDVSACETAAFDVPDVTVGDMTKCPVTESALEGRVVVHRGEVA